MKTAEQNGTRKTVDKKNVNKASTDKSSDAKTEKAIKKSPAKTQLKK